MQENSKPRFRAPSPAMTVACVALAVALSGAGYAAVTLPRNSVGTAQLKKGAVNSAKVRDGSLQSVDFGPGQLSAGPQGPQGQQGPPGPPNANAVNSDLLDNLDSTEFLRTTGKAADAELLDGLESTAFVQGNGNVLRGAVALAPSGGASFLGAFSGFFQVDYFCPSSLMDNGTLRFSNTSSDVLNVFHDSGTANPTYVSVSGGGSFQLPASPTGDSWVIQVQGAPGVAVINAASVHRASDCHAQGIATWSR